jgi:hypothetical protein
MREVELWNIPTGMSGVSFSLNDVVDPFASSLLAIATCYRPYMTDAAQQVSWRIGQREAAMQDSVERRC